MPLPLQELLIVVGLALAYLLILDAIKVLYYRRTDNSAARSRGAQPATRTQV